MTSFTEGLEKHKRLFVMWIATVAALTAANQLVLVSFITSMTLFVIGAGLLSATGISCAYAVVRESQ